MMKRLLATSVIVSAMAIAVPEQAWASDAFTGRITNYSATSLSVRDKEVVTIGIDNRTIFTKLITQKPWQEDTRLSARALGAGRYVIVHVRKDEPAVARWVEIATDMRLEGVSAAPVSAVSTPAPAVAQSTSKASDLLTPKQVQALIANAKTPADHVKLQKHFLALAAKYEAEASEHAAEAQAYRKNPTFLDSKHPLGPGTAMHCDRFAELSREAAKEARDLAAAHEQMAK